MNTAVDVEKSTKKPTCPAVEADIVGVHVTGDPYSDVFIVRKTYKLRPKPETQY